MSYSVLNDLAEAMKALDGKNLYGCFVLGCVFLFACLCGFVFWFLFFALACDDLVTDWTTYRSATATSAILEEKKNTYRSATSSLLRP